MAQKREQGRKDNPNINAHQSTLPPRSCEWLGNPDNRKRRRSGLHEPLRGLLCASSKGSPGARRAADENPGEICITSRNGRLVGIVSRARAVQLIPEGRDRHRSMQTACQFQFRCLIKSLPVGFDHTSSPIPY
jgi:hypothetical protein